MAKVVFWSPMESSCGVTHSALATATLMGIQYKAKAILMQANEDSKKMESAYTPYDQLIASGVLTSAETGIGALIKIIVSNKLSASTIKNYAKPVLKDRLDILYGGHSGESEQIEQILDNLPLIARRADEIYDLVYIDCPKGRKNKKVLDILSDADVVVCVFDQDIIKFREFFDLVERTPEIKDKPKIFLLANYEEKSKYNVRNIRTRFGIKDQIIPVPHNLYFVEACNDGNIVDFFYKNLNADPSDVNGNFLTNVNEVILKIIAETKIKDY